MGTDLILKQRCPSCKKIHDLAWLGRLHNYLGFGETELSEEPEIRYKIERLKTQLFEAVIYGDTEEIHLIAEDLVEAGERLLLARVLADEDVEYVTG